MQSIQIGIITVAGIMYAKWWKTSAIQELKGLTKSLYPSALRLIKSYLHAKFEVYRCYGLLQPDPEEEDEEEQVKITFTHIVHRITSDF